MNQKNDSAQLSHSTDRQNNAGASDYFWNTFGTFFYFLCQYLLTILVVRLGSFNDAGIFSIVLSITNVFYCISIYGVRNYQVADIENRFSDAQYIRFRHICSVAALLIFLAVLPFFRLPMYTNICCIVYLFYKFGESYTDVLFGIFQKRNEVRKIARSYMMKGIISVVTFSLGMILTHSLLVTLILNTAGIFAVLLLYDCSSEGGLRGGSLSRKKLRVLLRDCFPLMLYSLLVPALNLITRTDVEKVYGTEQLGYFSSVTMVLSILNTLMTSVFVILIPNMTDLYQRKKSAKLMRLVELSASGFFILAILGLLAGWMLGDLVFSIVFGKEILPYMNLLGPTIIASVELSAVTFFSSVLTAFSKNDQVLIGNLPAPLITLLFTPWMISRFQMLGAVYCLEAGLGLSLIVLLCFVLKAVRQLENPKDSDSASDSAPDQARTPGPASAEGRKKTEARKNRQKPALTLREKRRKNQDRLFYWSAAVLVLIAVAIAFLGSLGYDPANTPDENMRYEIAEFIYQNSRLPWGDEPELITAYGFNYSFAPYFPTIVGALFMKIAGLFSQSPLVLMAAFRQVSVLSLLGMGIYASMLAHLVFRRYGARLLFVALSVFWPQILFLGSYFNNDICTVFLGYGFVYCWLKAWKTGWTWPGCIHLGILCGALSITYYFGYAYLLASILVFCWMDWKQEKNRKIFWQKFLLVFVIAFAIGGWWFIKNAIFMPGDFLGFKATEYYQVTYGIPEVQNNATKNHMSFVDMLTKPYGGTSSWTETFLKSYVGLFSIMSIKMEPKYYDFYLWFVLIGMIFGIWCAVRLFLRRPSLRVILIALLLCLIIPLILSVVNSYINDYQPQGRYMISNLCPLLLLVSSGYEWINRFFISLQKRVSRMLTGKKRAYISLTLILALFMAYKSTQLYYAYNKGIMFEHVSETVDAF